jgi:hypothetical protein
MTISLKVLKARLLANPKVKAEYDGLSREFDDLESYTSDRMRTRPGSMTEK